MQVMKRSGKLYAFENRISRHVVIGVNAQLTLPKAEDL